MAQPGEPFDEVAGISAGPCRPLRQRFIAVDQFFTVQVVSPSVFSDVFSFSPAPPLCGSFAMYRALSRGGSSPRKSNFCFLPFFM